MPRKKAAKKKVSTVAKKPSRKCWVRDPVTHRLRFCPPPKPVSSAGEIAQPG